MYGGSILQNGQLIVLVEKVGDDTAISRIVQLLEEAQEKQAPIQNLADNLLKKWFLFPLDCVSDLFINKRYKSCDEYVGH